MGLTILKSVEWIEHETVVCGDAGGSGGEVFPTVYESTADPTKLAPALTQLFF